MEQVIQKTKASANKAVKATNGYKTVVSASVYLLVVVFGSKVPFLAENKVWIEEILMVAMASGIFHKVFRWALLNLDKIKDWSIECFKVLINKFKKS